MWSHLQVNAPFSRPRPLLLIGAGWRLTLETFIDQLGIYVAAKDRPLIQFVDHSSEAVSRLEELLSGE
jgi:hypothetical protein